MANEVRDRHVLAPEQITEASHYSAEVRWSPEDQVHIAEMPELNGARTHSDSPSTTADHQIARNEKPPGKTGRFPLIQ